MAGEKEAEQPAPKSLMGKMYDWGSSPVPPSLLAMLLISLHTRPRQSIPLFVVTPALFLSTYLNLAGFTTGAAGLSSAWSGLYAVMALRRRQGMRARMSVRGVVRGAAVGVGGVNCVAGGWRYFRGDWERDEVERRERNRWGTEE